MENANLYMACIGVLLLLGVFSNRFSRILKMPILVCFLLVGMLAGPHGFKLFNLVDDVQVAKLIGTVALTFILFTGGLQSSFKSIRSVFLTGAILATLGVVMTAFILGGIIYYLANLPCWNFRVSLVEALAFGTIFASTDAAAVFAILRGQKSALNPKLQSLLEFESGSNDPAAFFLMTILLSIMESGQDLAFGELGTRVLVGVTYGLGVGAVLGVIIGILGQLIYDWVSSFVEYDGLFFVIAIAIVLICFGFTEGICRANGMMACYVAGITMGNMRFNFKQTFMKFHDGVSWFMQIVLFTILGLFFDARHLLDPGVVFDSLLLSIVLMFLVRPLVCFVCMVGSGFNFKEKLFTSWVGIRGSAPIMLAICVMTVVDAEYRPFVFTKTFLVVLLSILIQGSTIMKLARKLGLAQPFIEKEPSPLEYVTTSPDDTREMFSFTVEEDSPLVGQQLKDCPWPVGVIIMVIKRDEHLLQPRDATTIKADDEVVLLGEHVAMAEVHRRFFENEEYFPSKSFRQIRREISKRYSQYFSKIGKRDKS